MSVSAWVSCEPFSVLHPHLCQESVAWGSMFFWSLSMRGWHTSERCTASYIPFCLRHPVDSSREKVAFLWKPGVHSSHDSCGRGKARWCQLSFTSGHLDRRVTLVSMSLLLPFTGRLPGLVANPRKLSCRCERQVRISVLSLLWQSGRVFPSWSLHIFNYFQNGGKEWWDMAVVIGMRMNQII